jgi:maleylacetoacetate isomerase
MNGGKFDQPVGGESYVPPSDFFETKVSDEVPHPKCSPTAKKQKVDEPILYSYWRSSCSWRVRIAMELKGIKYQYKAVHLVKDGGEQLKDENASVNAMKQVPSLLIDGNTLCQSCAIIEYLEDTRSAPALLPTDAAAKAKVREICQMVGADTQPVQNLRVLRKVMGMVPEEEKTKAKVEWGAHWINNGFAALERVLSKSAGKYCVGDELTMADLFIPPQVYNANRFSVDMSQYPTIARIDAELAKLPAFKAAHPSAQPDAQ